MTTEAIKTLGGKTCRVEITCGHWTRRISRRRSKEIAASWCFSTPNVSRIHVELSESQCVTSPHNNAAGHVIFSAKNGRLSFVGLQWWHTYRAGNVHLLPYPHLSLSLKKKIKNSHLYSTKQYRLVVHNLLYYTYYWLVIIPC